MLKSGKLMFGLNAVQSGQKSATVNAEPRLIVNSTAGKFTITAPVSKAMQIAPGENVAFANNIANVEQAIQTRNEAILQWAEENGVDINTAEGAERALAELTLWVIYKGVPTFDSKNQPIMANERYSKADKEKFIADNAADMLDGMREMLIERVGDANASDEELLAAITADDVVVPEYHVHTGSKASASSAAATGIGNQLGFTDTSIWNTLKADLGDDKQKKNRIFAVDVKEPITATINNGFEDVEVVAYPIEFLKDEDIIVREKKD